MTIKKRALEARLLAKIYANFLVIPPFKIEALLRSAGSGLLLCEVAPEPEPAPEPTPTPSPTPAPTPSPTPEPEPTPTPDPATIPPHCPGGRGAPINLLPECLRGTGTRHTFYWYGARLDRYTRTKTRYDGATYSYYSQRRYGAQSMSEEGWISMNSGFETVKQYDGSTYTNTTSDYTSGLLGLGLASTVGGVTLEEFEEYLKVRGYPSVIVDQRDYVVGNGYEVVSENSTSVIWSYSVVLGSGCNPTGNEGCP